jgi:CDP-diacylglycerol--serine O-phosphatidyltransferase
MRDDGRSAVARTERIDARVARLVRSSTGENMVHRLNAADWLSLTALFWGWAGAVLLVMSEPNWAIVAVLGGFVFDKLDGYYARKHDLSSAFGRQVDSFIDIFVYLVPAALLYHEAMAPHPAVSAVVGFVVLAFGGLRLVRHSTEGFGEGEEEDASYYVGTTVVHTHLVVLANYFLVSLVAGWNGWLAGAVVVAVCPLMTSRYRAYKTDFGHGLVGVAGLVAVGLALGLEYGLL